MSLIFTGWLSIFVGAVAIFVGIMDHCFPEQSIQWVVTLFGKEIKTYEVLFFIGLIAICIGIICMIMHSVKKRKKKRKHKHKKHHHSRKTRNSSSTQKQHMQPIAQVPKKICPHCNARLLPISKFCNICGEKLEVQTAEHEED